jgi:hypothetical protein
MLTVQTNASQAIGLTSVTFSAIDQLSGVASPLEKQLIRITDPCAAQVLTIMQLPSKIGYELLQKAVVYDFWVDQSLLKCPTSISLV